MWNRKPRFYSVRLLWSLAGGTDSFFPARTLAVTVTLERASVSGWEIDTGACWLCVVAISSYHVTTACLL